MRLAQLAVLLVLCLSLMLHAAGNADPPVAKEAIHRLDFRVEGASCVGCVRRIGATLRSTKGVYKADVSIYRPYWAVVIYDANQTNFEKLAEAIKSEHVKLVDVEDKPISQVPTIVLPKTINHAAG
jgi:copper chaperone CopZ